MKLVLRASLALLAVSHTEAFAPFVLRTASLQRSHLQALIGGNDSIEAALERQVSFQPTLAAFRNTAPNHRNT